MPKVENTRKHKADMLLRRLHEGPSLHTPIDSDPFTPSFAESLCRSWIRTWIRPLVKELVPEIRNTYKEYGYYKPFRERDGNFNDTL